VVLVTIVGGGHTWPGRAPFPEELGVSTANLDANDEIWQFFAGKEI
jgi:poly(3-hydroxybutyrate) depolymerase